MKWGQIRGFLFLLAYWLLAQIYVLVAIVMGCICYLGEKTPITHAFVKGFGRLLLNSRIEYLNPGMREQVRALDSALLLYNHRSIADFTICIEATAPGRIAYVSRMLVWALFPVGLLLIGLLERNAILFYRGAKDRQKLKRKLFARMRRRLERGLFVIVFPEGHRHSGPETLPLKRGAIDWSYAQNIPCAVVLNDGNEHIVNEKKMTFSRGVTVRCLHQGIYYPQDYSTADEFFAIIAAAFEQGYAALCAAR